MRTRIYQVVDDRKELGMLGGVLFSDWGFSLGA